MRQSTVFEQGSCFEIVLTHATIATISAQATWLQELKVTLFSRTTKVAMATELKGASAKKTTAEATKARFTKTRTTVKAKTTGVKKTTTKAIKKASSVKKTTTKTIRKAPSVKKTMTQKATIVKTTTENADPISPEASPRLSCRTWWLLHAKAVSMLLDSALDGVGGSALDGIKRKVFKFLGPVPSGIKIVTSRVAEVNTDDVARTVRLYQYTVMRIVSAASGLVEQ